MSEGHLRVARTAALQFRGSVSRLALSFVALSAATAVLPGAAHAQAAQDAGAPGVASPSAPAQAPDQNEAIVVTGSLIQRPNNTAVSPIVTVTERRSSKAARPTLQDALNQFPSFTAGGNAGNRRAGHGRPRVDQPSRPRHQPQPRLARRPAPAAVGHQRQRRHQHPARMRSSAAVDVITGGASAVYGSDAMSGVVNFRTVAVARRRQGRPDEFDQRARRRL